MTGKLVEILAKILEGLKKDYSLEEVNTKLAKNKHFDKQTVSVAFSLVYDKVLTNKISHRKKKKTDSKNIRLLSDEEKEILGIDNYNYMLHLNNIGLLDSSDFEVILEQLTMFPEDSITRDEINWIILISLVEFNQDIMPGSRLLLYSTDTIN